MNRMTRLRENNINQPEKCIEHNWINHIILCLMIWNLLKHLCGHDRRRHVLRLTALSLRTFYFIAECSMVNWGGTGSTESFWSIAYPFGRPHPHRRSLLITFVWCYPLRTFWRLFYDTHKHTHTYIMILWRDFILEVGFCEGIWSIIKSLPLLLSRFIDLCIFILVFVLSYCSYMFILVHIYTFAFTLIN